MSRTRPQQPETSDISQETQLSEGPAPNLNARVTRRNFIGWWIGGLLTATVVGVVAPLLAYVWPPPPAGQKRTAFDIKLDTPLDQLQDDKPVKFAAPSNGAFVMATGGGNNAPGDLSFGGYVVKTGGRTHVFSVTCSHLGCSIAPNASGAKTFVCP